MNGLDIFNKKYPNGINTIEDYLQEVSRTLNPKFNYLSNTNHDLYMSLMNVHLVLGIVDEMGEFIECTYSKSDIYEKIKELGDICWYLGNYCNINNIQWVPEHPNDTERYAIEKLAGIHKKELAYSGYIIDRDLQVKLTRSIIKRVLNLADMISTDIFIILTENIKKLYVRYPDTFSAELAVNKNEAVENQILKG